MLKNELTKISRNSKSAQRKKAWFLSTGAGAVSTPSSGNRIGCSHDRARKPCPTDRSRILSGRLRGDLCNRGRRHVPRGRKWKHGAKAETLNSSGNYSRRNWKRCRAHIGIKDVEDAIGHILSGEVQPFDVAKVISGDQVDYCTTLVGWNVVAEVNRVAEKLNASLGPPRYALAGLSQVLLSKRRRAKVIFDDHSTEDDFLLVTACNTSFVGSGMRFAPRAKTDDGMLDVVVVREASRWQLLSLFRKIFDGSHIEVDCVEYFQTRSLQILADDGQPLDIDGEVKGSTPFSVEVIPAAISIHLGNLKPTSA